MKSCSNFFLIDQSGLADVNIICESDVKRLNRSTLLLIMANILYFPQKIISATKVCVFFFPRIAMNSLLTRCKNCFQCIF